MFGGGAGMPDQFSTGKILQYGFVPNAPTRLSPILRIILNHVNTLEVLSWYPKAVRPQVNITGTASIPGRRRLALRLLVAGQTDSL